MTSALEFDEKRFWIALFSIVTRREARMQETEEDFRSENPESRNQMPAAALVTARK
jgi:hypothetical protein